MLDDDPLEGMKPMKPHLLPTPRPRQWKAQWIWPSTAPADESNVYAYFRKTFTLEQLPETAALFISADRLYQLFVNGERIGDGPPPSTPWYQYYDVYDISRLLRRGENAIAVIVYHVAAQPYGDADGRGRGGLVLEVTDAGNSPLVRTDGTWRARMADAWQKNTYAYGNAVAPHVECFDARREPGGWQTIGFDDSSWPAAGVIGSRWSSGSATPPAAGPWTKLMPREIPFMAHDTRWPERVVSIEENVDFNQGTTNLAPGLSMTGQPPRYTRCERVETLCTQAGTAVFQSSLEHLDRDFGSLYAPAIVLDFGRIVTARVQISLEGVDGGILDIGYAERLIDGHFNIAVDGAGIADRYIMKVGAQVFETFTWKAFRFLKLRFRSCPQPVTVRSLQAIISTYPYEERGLFHSNDATLNGVFEICRATIRLCSNDFLMDTPWREKGQWLGDTALVTLPAIQSCFGDTALPRKFLMEAGQHQFPTGLLANVSNFNSLARFRTWTKAIPDYSLWWIGSLLDQFLYTGDEALLHRLYPQALRILDTHLDYLNDRMLIENMPYWVLLDWADVEKRGICTAYNAIFYRALDCLHQLAQYKGDQYTSNLTRELRNAMKVTFDGALFDEKRGCYADASIDGKLSDKISEHGNLTPIWAGLCDKKRAHKLISTVFEDGGKQKLVFTEAQPFYMAVVLPALASAGRFDLALDLIRRRWGRRMLDIGATSVFECWQENGRWLTDAFTGLQNSHSHVWSACPADFLIRHMLGLKIIEPGCKIIQLAPECTDFNYQVVFPTPRGVINADCREGNVTLRFPDSIAVRRLNALAAKLP